MAPVELFDRRLMTLLTFLTRRQAWLSSPEISDMFKLDEGKISARTIHRWFSLLREKGGFVYYPYPKASAMGLSDVLLTVHGLRNPAVLGILPFASSFNVEVGLDKAESFVRQGYWVPTNAMREFREYWNTARDLDLIEDVEIFASRNTHFIFSPFQDMITEDGLAVWTHLADNSYFKKLIERSLREPFEVKMAESISDAPLIVPLVLERIWEFYSSRQVWEAIEKRGLARVLAHEKGLGARDLRKPGAALHLLQEQWAELMRHFEDVFVQPRVFFDWPSLRNSNFLTVMMRAASPQSMLEAVTRISERSIYTSLKPSVELDGQCHLNCFLPSDQMASVARIIGEYHKDDTPPLVTIQDRAATLELFQPSFCKLDWSLFEPTKLSWIFRGDDYAKRLKTLKPQAIIQPGPGIA